MKSAEASVPQGVWSLEVVSSHLNPPILSPWGEGFRGAAVDHAVGVLPPHPKSDGGDFMFFDTLHTFHD